MVGIQRLAATKTVPYQSLISGLIQQFVEGDRESKRQRLKGVAEARNELSDCTPWLRMPGMVKEARG